MSGENNQNKKNKDEKSLSFRYPSQKTTIKLCFAILVILFIGKTCYIKSAPIDTKTKSIQKETIKDTDNNEKTILNISNLPIVKYEDCIENGMYKISQRDARRKFTHVASFSPKEFVFINGYYHFGANKANTTSAKQEKINQIEIYNITNDKYSKILEAPKAKIRMDKIPFDEKNLLFRDGATLYSYNIPKNKLVLICDNFDYFMLFPYQNNEFLLNKNDNLYVLNTQTKEIKFLKKLTISLNPPLFKINDDLFICISGNSGKTKPIIYSIKQNKIYDELDISEINTVEKISDDKLLIIETLKQNVDVQKTPTLKTAGEFNYIANIYDIKNKKISKKIMLDEQSVFKEKYHLKKLSNDNLLLYNTHALLKIFDINNLKFQDIKHEYQLNNDGIEQIININDHQILINTQKNIYMYQY